MIHGGDIYDKKLHMDASVNVNPLGYPSLVQEILNDAGQWLTQYPDPECRDLRGAIAERLEMDFYQILPGNGASELIMALMHAYMPKKMLVVAPGFYGYLHGAEAINCQVVYYRLQESKGFKLGDDFKNQITSDTDMVFLTNPNNPTGLRIPDHMLEDILKVCHDTGTILVLDECFMDLYEGMDLEAFDYYKRTRAGWIRSYPELILLRAFTKTYGIPSIRLGYMASEEMNIIRVKKQLGEWNVSLPAQKIGCGLLAREYSAELESYLDETRQLLRDERDYLEGALCNLADGGTFVLKYYKTQANYMMLYSDLPLYDEFLKRGILVRNCDNYIGLGPGYVRFSIGTHEKNQMLIHALRDILTANDLRDIQESYKKEI